MTFIEAITTGFHDYFKFSGRSIRSEFWYWTLFTVLVGLILAVIDIGFFGDMAVAPLSTIFNVVTFIPSIAVSMRRLHDIGRTGMWLLIMFTVIGIVLLIYWFCQRGTPGPNQYGDEPLSGL